MTLLQAEAIEVRAGAKSLIRDVSIGLAPGELVVFQARALVAEHPCHLFATASRGHGLGGRLPGIEFRQGHAAAACREAQYQGGAGQPPHQIGVDTRPGQHVVGTGGHRRGLVVRETVGRYQLQAREAHGTDGPRGRTDIARMRGTHQDITKQGVQGGNVHRRGLVWRATAESTWHVRNRRC